MEHGQIISKNKYYSYDQWMGHCFRTARSRFVTLFFQGHRIYSQSIKKKKKMHLGLQGSVTQGSGLKLTQVTNETMNQSEGKNTAFLLQITYQSIQNLSFLLFQHNFCITISLKFTIPRHLSIYLSIYIFLHFFMTIILFCNVAAASSSHDSSLKTIYSITIASPISPMSVATGQECFNVNMSPGGEEVSA